MVLPSNGKESITYAAYGGGALGLPCPVFQNESFMEELRTALDRMREFEQNFEQKYGRKMTDEEQRVLNRAREIIQKKLAEHSQKVA